MTLLQEAISPCTRNTNGSGISSAFAYSVGYKIAIFPALWHEDSSDKYQRSLFGGLRNAAQSFPAIVVFSTTRRAVHTVESCLHWHIPTKDHNFSPVLTCSALQIYLPSSSWV